MAVAITFTAPVEFLIDLKAAARAQDISKSKLFREAFYGHVRNKHGIKAEAEPAKLTEVDFDEMREAAMLEAMAG
jgi:hypothetical protein